MFSADEGADIRLGEGKACPYPVPFKFTGKISKVTIELKPRAAAIAIDADRPVGKSLCSDVGGLTVLAGLVLYMSLVAGD